MNMTTQKNTVNSGKAKSSAKRGLKFTRELLVELHWIQGLSLSDIGRRYGVTAQAIKYWLDKHDLEHRSQLQNVLFEPSPTLSYVFGVLHGDGFLYFNPANNHYHILMSVVDRMFADSFSSAINRLGLRTTIRYEAPRTATTQPQWKVWATSKKFHELWNDLSTEQRLDWGLTYERDFIRGVYESDGSVKFHRGSLELSITKPDIAMLRRVESCMVNQGYTVRWYERTLQSGTVLGGLNLYRSLEIRRFLAWIAPCIKFQPRGYVNPEPSQSGDILEGVETTKDD